MFARVNLVVSRREDALLIPERALLARGGKSFVYAVEQGKAIETEVEIGEHRPGEVEGLKGLYAGQVIVTSGLQRIGRGRDQADRCAARTGQGTRIHGSLVLSVMASRGSE